MNKTFHYTIVTDTANVFRLENDKLVVSYFITFFINCFILYLFSYKLSRDNYVERCIAEPILCPHDYEQITSLLLRILVEDDSQPPASQKFWIQVQITDENDPPVNLILDENTVKENSPSGKLVGSFSVDDQDLYQTHTYELINEESFTEYGRLFTIEDNNLRLLRSPDYELEQFILITVQVTDNGVPMRSVSNL